jgi:hypothetical protein
LLLKNLDLITEQGYLTHATILLFGKSLIKATFTASFKIRRFGKSIHDLLFQDIIESNIFDMPDKVMETLKSKYLVRPISYKGLERMEPSEYPEAALREAILNAIIHIYYLSTYYERKHSNDKCAIPGVIHCIQAYSYQRPPIFGTREVDLQSRLNWERYKLYPEKGQ